MLRKLLDLPQEEYRRVGGALFAYLFHRISWKELRQRCPEHLDKLKHIIKHEGHVLRDCKLYAHNYWVAMQRGERAPRASLFGIEREDLWLLQHLNLSHIDAKYGALSIVQLETKLHQAVYAKEIETYIAKFVNKKLLFLVKSFGVDREDLMSQMQLAATKGLYKQYPFFESDLHFRNVAKNIIKKEGNSIILYHTRASRNRLTQDEHGHFQQVQVPLDAVFDVEYEASTPDTVKDALHSIVQVSRLMRPKQQRFILIAAGQFDQEFSDHIRVNNAEAVERWPYERYLEKVKDFLGVSDAQVGDLFTSLREHMSGSATFRGMTVS